MSLKCATTPVGFRPRSVHTFMKKKYLVLSLVILVVLVFIEERSGILKEGTVAPDFTATLSSGKLVSLSDYRGKSNVVLFFYPEDFTTGCTAQACAFRDDYETITELGAVVLGVSRDDALSHELFIAAHRLPFALITDTTASLIKAYGVQRLGGLIKIPKRVTYVVDKHGVIRLAAHHELLMKKHVEEVIETLRMLAVEGR